MKVLVTGGAGFIGSHLCERLLQDGHQVAILDDFNDFYSPARKQENLDAVRSVGRVSFYPGDICDPATVERVIREQSPEAIIHLAARAGVRPSLEQPLLYERVNVHGTLLLLETARKAGVRKFVFASSSSIYGIANRVPFSEEDHLNLPVSPYAATKLAGEKLCYTYSHLYGLQTVCLRFFTVYGPRQRPDLAIHKFTRLMLDGQPIPVFGDGDSGRDYTFVADTVQGIIAALHYDAAYEIFNLGNSHPVTLSTLIESLETVTGLTAKIDRLPDQPGDVPITYADISKARNLLGYQPRTSFVEGLRQFNEWYVAIRQPARTS
jgi:UDP-glucuronate 4-epimerase